MARLVNGHGTALDALMERHGEPLYHYLIRLLQNEDKAEDLAQETFVQVYQNCARFKAGSKFSTWLYTIATNRARDHFRRHSRHKEVSLDGKEEGDESGLKNILPGGDLNPSQSLEADERAQAVRRAVADLPEDLRVPLTLAEFQEQSQAEIAVVLNCSTKAVEMRLYRARQQLRQRLVKWLERI